MKTNFGTKKTWAAAASLIAVSCLGASPAHAANGCSIEPYRSVIEPSVLQKLVSGSVKEQSDALGDIRGQMAQISPPVRAKGKDVGLYLGGAVDMLRTSGGAFSDFKTNCKAIGNIDIVLTNVRDIKEHVPAGTFKNDVEAQAKRLDDLRFRLNAFCGMSGVKGWMQKKGQEKEQLGSIQQGLREVRAHFFTIGVAVAEAQEFDKCHSDRIANLSAAHGLASLPGQDPKQSAPLLNQSTDRPAKNVDYSEAVEAAGKPKPASGSAKQ